MTDLSNSKVLLVDDTETNIDILMEILGDDYDVSIAMDGEGALEAVEDELPDLILLDIMMPGMDGYEVCKRIKTDDDTREIPVIFLTAKAEVEDETKGLSLGAVDYVTKPISPPILLARIETHLKLKRAQDALKREVAVQKALRGELSDTLKLVSSSIQYAALIQSALLPDNALLDKFFKESFVIWHPRDIVGGDIYLFDKLRSDDECLLMVIDCVGHGVPGALVTMLTKALERQIVAEILHHPEREVSPAWILNYFNVTMKKLLKQDDSETVANAGFDGGVLYYNKKEQYIKFAGAETPLFYTQDGEFQMIKGDRHSIGYKGSDTEYQFKEHRLDVSNGMTIVLTTDGFLDQGGGKKGFSFGKKRFRALIQDHANETMESQKGVLLHELTEYQGKAIRRDDITVVGLRI